MRLPNHILPAHPHPQTDELFTSWIIRIARANGVKSRALCRVLFGVDITSWNRDTDRYPPRVIVKKECTDDIFYDIQEFLLLNRLFLLESESKQRNTDKGVNS